MLINKKIRCHADGDGDCDWEHCPQNNIKYETSCLLDFYEGDADMPCDRCGEDFWEHDTSCPASPNYDLAESIKAALAISSFQDLKRVSAQAYVWLKQKNEKKPAKA